MGRLFFPASRLFDSDVVIYKVFFPICALTWHLDIFVSRQGKGINRRNESTEEN